MKNRNIKHKDDWETPRYFYDKLNKVFNFDFDPCPFKHNLSLWDGLEIDWKERNFCNPPYSKPLKDRFIHKAYNESKKGKVCVLLIPVSTSTKTFHNIIKYNASAICFVEGRISFKGVNSKGIYTETDKPMHDSMVVVFDPNNSVTSKQLDEIINCKKQPSLSTFLRSK